MELSSHLSSQGLLNPVISFRNMEGVKITMQVSINWHCCRPNPSTKTLQAKVTDLSRCLLRASCDGRYFHSLNLLAWTDLSQQRCGSATTAPFSYSDATTFKSAAGVYISYTPALRCIWMISYIIHIHISAVVYLILILGVPPRLVDSRTANY